MRLTLPPDLERFIELKVQSGKYASADAVVEDALARWKADEQIDPDELKRLVAEGQSEADRGELLDADEVFREIHDKSDRHRRDRP
jgi:antitoxin ParD1/3/4